MPVFTVRGLQVLCLLIATLVCIRAEADDSTISLNRALELTVERNPELVAFGYQQQAQQGKVEQARFGPAPTLALLAENIASNGGFEDVDLAQTTLTLSWYFERGKADRRLAVASAGASLLEVDGDIKRLDASAETARRFLDCLDIQEQLKQIDQAVALSEQMVTAMQRRVSAGRSREGELARAAAQLARRKLEREDAEHVLRVALKRLAAQWGDNEPQISAVAGNYANLPKPVEYIDLMARIDSNPNITRYLNEQRLREAEVSFDEAQAQSNWRVDVGLRRFDETSDYSMVAGFSVPLFSKSRKESRTAVSRARLAQVEADSTVARLRVETELFALYEELNHSLHRAETLSERILPQIELALADAERAYAAGRYGYFELSVMQAEMLNTRAELTKASIDSHRILVELERLTGVTMTAEPLMTEEEE